MVEGDSVARVVRSQNLLVLLAPCPTIVRRRPAGRDGVAVWWQTAALTLAAMFDGRAYVHVRVGLRFVFGVCVGACLASRCSRAVCGARR